jgi:hypothetical protein
MTKKPSNTQVNFLAAGGQDSDKWGLIAYTWICKNCTMVACRRDNFVAKEPGPEPADCATNVYSLNRRAVRLSKNLPFLLITIRLVIL